MTGPDKRYDLLEAELRTRERELLNARQELAQLRILGGGYPGVPHAEYPEFPGQFAVPMNHSQRPGQVRISSVTLGTGTGGRDDDGIPGDELLQVVVVPKDDDGTAIKIPAQLAVAAFEINTEGLKIPIGKWEVSNEQLRKTWKSGLLGSGYFIPLSWDRPPTVEKVRVVIRLQLADGRVFEADKDVKVIPLVRGSWGPDESPRIIPVTPTVIPGPVLPESDELPFPRSAQPGLVPTIPPPPPIR